MNVPFQRQFNRVRKLPRAAQVGVVAGVVLVGCAANPDVPPAPLTDAKITAMSQEEALAAASTVAKARHNKAFDDETQERLREEFYKLLAHVRSEGGPATASPDVPPAPLTDAEITTMSKAEALAAASTIVKARLNKAFDDATQERLREEFRKLLAHVRSEAGPAAASPDVPPAPLTDANITAMSKKEAVAAASTVAKARHNKAFDGDTQERLREEFYKLMAHVRSKS